MIKEQSKILMKDLYPQIKFKASNGWLDRFLRRNRFSYRASTHAIQKFSDKAETEAIEFWATIKRYNLII